LQVFVCCIGRGAYCERQYGASHNVSMCSQYVPNMFQNSSRYETGVIFNSSNNQEVASQRSGGAVTHAWRLACFLAVAFLFVAFFAAPVQAQSTAKSILGRLEAASPGDEITLLSGTVSLTKPLVITKGGAEGQVLILKAAGLGKTKFTGTGGLILKDVSYVRIEGFNFEQHNDHPAIRLINCQHVEIARNTFQINSKHARRQNWIHITGDKSGSNRVEYNLFEGKYKPGACVAIDGSEKAPFIPSKNDRIAHNIFRGIAAGTDQASSIGPRAIRVGWSGMAQGASLAVIEFNLFEECNAAEFVTIRSGGTNLRFNTFRNCAGYATLRTGKNNTAEGNFFFAEEGEKGVGGISVMGQGARVFNNYFENLSKPAISMPNGRADVDAKNATSQPVARVPHPAATGAKVVHNTMVNCTNGSLAIGTGKSELMNQPPKDCEIANNVVISYGDSLVKMHDDRAGITWVANIMYHSDGKTHVGVTFDRTQAITVFPKVRIASGIWRLGLSSPAIDKAVGKYDFVQLDIDGQPRLKKNDIGADEFVQMPIKHRPLIRDDVGPGGE
jgi:poly(beta-D-mannuronate) lyase